MKVVYGESQLTLSNDMVENLRTVADVYDKFVNVLGLPSDPEVLVNGESADFDTPINAEDTIEFVKISGKKA